MITFGPNGLAINTYDEILAEIQTDYRTAFGVSIATKVDSMAGQLQRLQALRESQIQEVALELWQSLDPRLAEGVPLDVRNSLLGVTRLPAAYAEVLGTFTGDPTTEIPDGFRVQVGDYVFQTANGPYTIGAGGTVSDVEVVAEELGEVDVSVLGAWSLVDALSGVDAFDDDSQPVLGRLEETDAGYRERAEVERYRRASGPLDAIESAVSQVDGVTYVRAYHNITTDPVDSDGIPYHAINVVVVGGLDAEVAAAIWESGPAGHLFYGTDVTETVTSGVHEIEVSFDRVTEIELWVDIVAATSTSEETPPADLEALVRATLLDWTNENWNIGTDVLPHRLVGSLASIAGVDGFTITTSLTGGGGSYNGNKRAISLREQAVLTDARITFSEA